MNDLNAKFRPNVHGGSRLALHPAHQAGRKPVYVTVDHIENSQIWVKGSSGAVGLDGKIVLEYMIEDDGRYLAQGEIEGHSPDCTVITWDGEWRRIQDRCFVRISTHGVEVEVPARTRKKRDNKKETGVRSKKREKKEENEGDGIDRFEMLDVSAGGIRFESREPFDFDEEIVCHFELPGKSPYELPARVVRSQTKPGDSQRYRVAVEFIDLPEAQRSELLQWIFQEQARRHKAKRRAS